MTGCAEGLVPVDRLSAVRCLDLDTISTRAPVFAPPMETAWRPPRIARCRLHVDGSGCDEEGPLHDSPSR